MTFDEYQKRARETAVYQPTMRKLYPALGLAGEVGEFCNKLKKHYRDGIDIVGIDKELGDILWYLAQCATDFGFDLSTIAETNLQRLADRKARGVIHGSGDNR